MFRSTLLCDCDSNTPLQRFICCRTDIQKSQKRMNHRNIFIEFPSLEVIVSSWCHPKSTDDQLLTVSTISRLYNIMSYHCPHLVESAPALRLPRVEMTQTMAELGRVLVVMTMALLLTLRPRCH